MENKNLKSLRVVLIVSLCFNVLFLSGLTVAFLTARKLHAPKERIAAIANNLKLTSDQRMDLREIFRSVREYREENPTGDLNALCEELGKANPDYAKINQLMGQLVEGRSKYLGFVSQQAQSFLKELTFDQREILVKQIRAVYGE